VNKKALVGVELARFALGANYNGDDWTVVVAISMSVASLYITLCMLTDQAEQ
jgi:hypothetical protein